MKVGIVDVFYGSPKGHSYVNRDIIKMLQDDGHEVHVYRINNATLSEEFVEPTTMVNLEGVNNVPKEAFEKWIDDNELNAMFFNEYNEWWKDSYDKLDVCKEKGVMTVGYLVWEKLDFDNQLEHYKKYDHLIAPTGFQTKLMRKKGLYKTIHVPWGVDFAEFDSINKPKHETDTIKFFHCAGSGGVDDRKNTDKIIKAFQLIDDESVELIITHLGAKVFSRKDIIRMTKHVDVVVNTAKWDTIGINCQPKGSLIYNSFGMTTIENVSIGDKVLTHTGTFKKVINTMEGKNNILNIKCDYTKDIKLTPEHPVLILPLTKKDYKKKNIKYNPIWKKALEIEPYNFIAVPKPKEVIHNDYLPLKKYIDTLNIMETENSIYNKYTKNMKGVNYSVYTLAKIFNTSKNTIYRILNNVNTKQDALTIKNIHELYDNYKVLIPKKIKVDKNLCRLLGFFVAEGWTEKGSTFGFAFHTKEKEYHEFILKNMKSIFNLDGKLVTRGNGTHILFFNSIVSDFLETICGKYAEFKDVPTFLLNENIDLQKEFLKGYFYGDGCIGKKTVTASTISEHLAYGIKYLLLRCNILSKVTKYKSGNRIWNSKDFYCMRLAHSKEMCELFDLKYIKSRYTMYLEDNDYFYVNVRRIEEIGQDRVYNITVEEDSSYCGEIVLHNSLESNACGKPVIVCDASPMNELVQNNVNGLTVACKIGTSPHVTCPSADVDVEDLAEKMNMLKNKLILVTLKHNSRKFAETNFDWKNNKEHFLKLFRGKK